MSGWKERAMNCLFACCAARRGAVMAYVMKQCTPELACQPQKGTRDQSTVTRHGSTRSVFKLTVARPPYSLSSSFFSVWPASRCFPLFSLPYLFQPMRLLPSNHSPILMALSTLPKVGAGPIAVSRLYSLYITHTLTHTFLFKACQLMLSKLSPLASPLTLQSLDRT
jgi:hypothetical protein